MSLTSIGYFSVGWSMVARGRFQAKILLLLDGYEPGSLEQRCWAGSKKRGSNAPPNIGATSTWVSRQGVSAGPRASFPRRALTPAQTDNLSS